MNYYGDKYRIYVQVYIIMQSRVTSWPLQRTHSLLLKDPDINMLGHAMCISRHQMFALKNRVRVLTISNSLTN